MLELHDDYRHKADFLFVQIRQSGHALPTGLEDQYRERGLSEDTPANARARACLAADFMGVYFPSVIDGEDAAVCQAYGAFPERLVVVADGQVVFDAGSGLAEGGRQGWDMAAVRRHLDEHLPADRVHPQTGD